ncbi:MAG: hypothetical protein WCE98_03175, partial [Chlorobium sp.]
MFSPFMVGFQFVRRVLQGGKATSCSFRVLPCRKITFPKRKKVHAWQDQKSFQKRHSNKKHDGQQFQGFEDRFPALIFSCRFF